MPRRPGAAALALLCLAACSPAAKGEAWTWRAGDAGTGEVKAEYGSRDTATTALTCDSARHVIEIDILYRPQGVMAGAPATLSAGTLTTEAPLQAATEPGDPPGWIELAATPALIDALEAAPGLRLTTGGRNILETGAANADLKRVLEACR